MLTQDLDPGGRAAPQGSPADPPPGAGVLPLPGGGKGQSTTSSSLRRSLWVYFIFLDK